jgi:HlyD family secretion protein
MKNRRRWIVLGIVVVLVAVGVVLITNNQRSAAQAAAQANVQMGRVTRATLLSTVDSSGSVTPESKVTLSFGTSGTVAKVNVQVGDHVKKGDVLAELDASSLQLQLAQQQQSFLSQQASYSMTIQPDPDAVKSAQIAFDNAAAAYRLAQQKYAANGANQVLTSCSNLDNAKQTYDDAVNAYNALLANWRAVVNGSYQISPQKAQLDRAKAAYDVALANCNLSKSTANDSSGVQSAAAQLQQAKLNLDTLMTPSELTLAMAKAQLDQARLSLTQVQQQLDNAKIVAPFNGVVTQVNAIVGGASGSATIVAADDAQLNIGVLVDETQIGQLNLGQKVQVTFDGLPGTTTTGTVGRINPAGTVSQGVVNYLVNVDLDPTTSTLRLDMSANVRIILETHANVLAVPGGSIRTDAQGYYVNVVDQAGTGATRVDVTTGFTDGDLTEVSGNLQPNERVYISAPPTRQQGGGFNLFGLRLGGG